MSDLEGELSEALAERDALDEMIQRALDREYEPFDALRGLRQSYNRYLRDQENE